MSQERAVARINPRGSGFLRDQPYVSRGPRPGTLRGPWRQDGAPGFKNLISLIPASGNRSRIVPRMLPRIDRNCVAHAVESHCTCNTPASSTNSGRVCFAVCSPVSVAHESSTLACSNGRCQPYWLRSCRIASPPVTGSRCGPNGSWSAVVAAVRPNTERERNETRLPANTSLKCNQTSEDSGSSAIRIPRLSLSGNRAGMNADALLA